MQPVLRVTALGVLVALAVAVARSSELVAAIEEEYGEAKTLADTTSFTGNFPFGAPARRALTVLGKLSVKS